MTSNNAWPLRLPRRLFGGQAFARVAYRSAALGPVGWLARHGKRGAVPLELRRAADGVRTVFDHAEAWLRIDESGARHLDDRLLIGHPYGFEATDRAAIERAADAFGFSWTAVPPGASWYAPNAWLIIAHPRHLLPLPGDELPTPRARRPLAPGEYVTSLPSDQDEARRLAKRKYNRDRYEAKKAKPMTLGAILSDPKRAAQEIRRRKEVT